MLVSCPKCASRYQLSDDKIRTTGTKVRCPRCQHTFKIFKPENEVAVEDEVSEDRTELFIRREVPEPEQTVTKKETAASRSKTEIQPQTKTPSPFKYEAKEEEMDANIEAAAEFPGFQPTPMEDHQPTQITARPFSRDPAKSDKQPIESSEPESIEEDTAAPRPFGDATFLAIQRMGTGKTGKRKVLIAASLVIILVGGFLYVTRNPSPDVSQRTAVAPAQIESVKMTRPNRWYNDEPEVYQRFLSQMATLPASEQAIPKNKALIAEALILNGILSGNYDQVAQGMGFASSLIASSPSEIYGFYALSTFATFKEDTTTLSGLVLRWPEGNKKDLEYKLAFILSGIKNGKKIEALEMSKNLLIENPGLDRVQIVVLAAALESWNEANQILGEKNLQEITKVFQKKKEGLEKSGAQLSDLYVSIDRKLQRKAQTPKSEPKVEVEPKVEAKMEAAPPPSTNKESITERLNRRAAERMQAKRQQREQQAAATPEKAVPANKKHLPKPNSTLIATNKQAKQEQSEAAKLYNQGADFMKSNKLDEAAMAFQKSLRFDPDFADSYKKLGEIYMKRSDKERALRSFKIYLQLKPDSSDKQLVEGWISSLQ